MVNVKVIIVCEKENIRKIKFDSGKKLFVFDRFLPAFLCLWKIVFLDNTGNDAPALSITSAPASTNDNDSGWRKIKISKLKSG